MGKDRFENKTIFFKLILVGSGNSTLIKRDNKFFFTAT